MREIEATILYSTLYWLIASTGWKNLNHVLIVVVQDIFYGVIGTIRKFVPETVRIVKMGFVKHLYNDNYFLNLYKKRTRTGRIRKDQRLLLSGLGVKNKTVLDIGCGCGEIMLWCLERNPKHVIGIDFSPSALKLARIKLKDHSNYTLIQEDVLTALPKMYIQFDTILMMDSIEHIPADEIDEVLTHVHRLCKRNLIVQTPHYKIYDDYKKQKFYYNETDSDKIPETRGMHCTKYTKERLIKLLAKHGFVTKDAFRYRRIDAKLGTPQHITDNAVCKDS